MANVVPDGEAVVAITFDASGTTVTISGKTTAGSNRVGVVRVGWSDAAITGITWNGVAMVQKAHHTDAVFSADIWTIVNPPTAASDIVITFASGSQYGGAAASSYNNVDQTTPVRVGSPVGGNGAGTTPTVDCASAVGDLVVDVIETYSVPISASGAGQTQEFSNSAAGGTRFAAGSYKDGASSVTMSWTAVGNLFWDMVAVSLQQATGGGGGGGGNTSDCAAQFYNQLTPARF